MSDQHLEKEGGEGGRKEGRWIEGEDEDGDENGGEGTCFDCLMLDVLHILLGFKDA